MKVIILEYVFPAIGIIIGNVMFSAPYRDLKRSIDRGHIGDLNPTPWAFMLGNCLGWVTYSVLRQNLWIFVGNCPGMLLSVWLNLGAAKLLYQRHHSQSMRESFVHFLKEKHSEQGLSSQQPPQEESSQDPSNVTDWAKLVWGVTSQTRPAPAPHETLVLAIVIVWTACLSLICFAQAFDGRTRELIVGCLVNLNLVFFYGAPLSTIWKVLREGNSASIHLPTMLTNTVNGTFWGVYGLAILDPFVYVPNGIGTALGVVQIFLVATFPRRSLSARGKGEEEGVVVTGKDGNSNPSESDKLETSDSDDQQETPMEDSDQEMSC